MRRKVLRLVRPEQSRDVIQCIEGLLEDAKLGKLVGFAGAFLQKGGEYTVEIRGEARRRPTSTYGMIGMVRSDLLALMRRNRT